MRPRGNPLLPRRRRRRRSRSRCRRSGGRHTCWSELVVARVDLRARIYVLPCVRACSYASEWTDGRVTYESSGHTATEPAIRLPIQHVQPSTCADTINQIN